MSNHHYDVTARGVMEWAKSELEHVGRIASVKDKDLQYSYAMSTVYGMAHLKDALKQLVDDEDYEHKRADLLKLHDAVVRVMKKLVGDYGINLNAVREFNERGVLSNLGYLDEAAGVASANMTNSNSWRKSEWMNDEESSESSEEEESENENNMNITSQNGGKRRLRRRKTRRAAAVKRKAKRGTRRR